ncbi:hypothetical protein HNR67_003752 [Crossiella cryophila]|uniref:Uncharacterized protein n=1 Tax=Crossiella cryophila TaxID=43355 RepID=A0A7W7FW80_9PSEU|nr:hypothetical protein [Crossiella cryophila]
MSRRLPARYMLEIPDLAALEVAFAHLERGRPGI